MAALGDFNKDGKIDIAFLEFPSVHGPNSFFLLLGNGDGTFQTTSPIMTQAIQASFLRAISTTMGSRM